ncbi:MAG TPA: T9SS type A sorting domain-containing protein [Clostridiales bacterium]|nr:T9SS type A sorting domain-containing protein [Clostridiales bacterium]
MRKVLYIFLFIFTFQSFSQKIDTWERRYGGVVNEGGKQIIRMNDGNYTNIENYVYEVSGYELYQNYPNPFNPTTEISYSLKTAGQVTLSVFNVKGELVSTLVNEKKSMGIHSVDFSADGLNSGIYFYRLVVEDKVVASKKMMMLK